MLNSGIVTCDTCGKQADLRMIPFQKRVKKIKALGWSSTAVGNKWQHDCKDCVSKAQTAPPIKHWQN